MAYLWGCGGTPEKVGVPWHKPTHSTNKEALWGRVSVPSGLPSKIPSIETWNHTTIKLSKAFIIQSRSF